MLSRTGGISERAETSNRWLNGISQDLYNAYRLANGLSAQDVLLIQTDEVRAIYRQVWTQAKCGALSMPQAIACLEQALWAEGDRANINSLPLAPSELHSQELSASSDVSAVSQTLSQSASGNLDEFDKSSRYTNQPADISNAISAEPISPEAIAYLLDVALGSEYGNAEPVIRKWQSEIRIQVRGNPTPDDEHTLNQVIQELSNLTGLPFRLDEANPNITFYFVPEAEFSSYEPKYVPVNMGFAWVGWSHDNVMQSARILITTEGITQIERNHLIREELTQVVSGCMKDSNRYPDSIFYQPWTHTTTFSQLDQDVIRLMYQPEVTPGMNQEQLLDVLSAQLASNPSQ
jgi:hypothetical protein